MGNVIKYLKNNFFFLVKGFKELFCLGIILVFDGFDFVLFLEEKLELNELEELIKDSFEIIIYILGYGYF